MVFFTLRGKQYSTEQLPGYESVFLDFDVSFRGPFDDPDPDDEYDEKEEFNPWTQDRAEMYFYGGNEGIFLGSSSDLWSAFRELSNIEIDSSGSDEYWKNYNGWAEVFVKSE